MDYRDVNDFEVLYLIAENQTDCKNIIFEKYKPIIISLCNKYFVFVKNRGIEYDDLQQEALIALNYAVDHFNSEKNNTFYTYAILCINSRLKTYVHTSYNNKNKILNDSLSIDLSDDKDIENIGIDSYYDESISFIDRIIEFKNTLDFEKSLIFELKYNGFTNKEISKLLELSVKNVYYSVCSIRKKLLISGFRL